MKRRLEEKPLTFGRVWTEIATRAHKPYWREHRGEFGARAVFFLVAGAIVRWFAKPERGPQSARPHSQPRPA